MKYPISAPNLIDFPSFKFSRSSKMIRVKIGVFQLRQILSYDRYWFWIFSLLKILLKYFFFNNFESEPARLFWKKAFLSVHFWSNELGYFGKIPFVSIHLESKPALLFRKSILCFNKFRIWTNSVISNLKSELARLFC